MDENRTIDILEQRKFEKTDVFDRQEKVKTSQMNL